MSKKEYYAGIDRFRLVAALLIVAIHTSPLATYSETGDFVLTRIIARIAVPFFFMTSGFFLISRYRYGNGRLVGFVKRTAIIYAAAIVFYLPVNIYTGYFYQDDMLPSIVQDIVFDGTMYHLWYLPASILGAFIVWRLTARLGFGKSLCITAVLYAVGLFGDSYYGLSAGAPVIRQSYDMMFELFDYTRNGIFFAPIFMLLGGIIAEKKERMPLKRACVGFSVSLVIMLSEGLMLHAIGVQRHDSMYVFLPVCMYFLFSAILHVQGRKVSGLRTVSLLVYIVHPMMIIVLRGTVKLLHMSNLLIENSLVNYMAVCLLSIAFSVFATKLWLRYFRREKHDSSTDRAYVEIDTDALIHNAEVLREAMPPRCELMAVVKADAYGHGAYVVSTSLERNGVSAFAVATVDEGIALRSYGIRGDILILGYTDVRRARDIHRYHLTQTVIDTAYAQRLAEQRIPIKAHIKIDTGMHRLGIAYDDITGVKSVFNTRFLQITGMFTHLCCCSSSAPDDVEFTREQIRRFYQSVDALKASGIDIPKLHIQSSYGLMNYPYLECDYVRAGIALYGVHSSPNCETALHLDLRPVLSLKSSVALIRDVPKGEPVGYDRKFIAQRDSRIVVVPIGYADGFPRSLSCGRASVRIGENIAPVIGRICMDQLAVDITDAYGIEVGDTVTLIEAQSGSALGTPFAAESADSISNELLSRLGARLGSVCT